MSHGAIYDGNNPQNIASQGLVGPVESVTIASQGFITPLAEGVADIVLGGDAPHTTFIDGTYVFYYPACPQGITLGGTATAGVFYAASMTVCGEGDLTTSPSITYSATMHVCGEGDLNTERLIGASMDVSGEGIFVGNGSVIYRSSAIMNVAGEGDLTTDPSVTYKAAMNIAGEGTLDTDTKTIRTDVGRGGAIVDFIPARKIEKAATPHHWIYKAGSYDTDIVFSGSAEVTFIKTRPRLYTKPLEDHIYNIETEKTRDLTPRKEKKVPVLQSYIDKVPTPSSYSFAPSDAGVTISGHSNATYFNHKKYMTVRDDEYFLNLEMFETHAPVVITHVVLEDKNDDDEVLMLI